MISDPQDDDGPIEESQDSGHRILLGLGNPGAEYVSTPHNVGFEALDLYATRLQLQFELQPQLSSAIVEVPNSKIVLVKPTTFMNLSGVALRKLWQHYGIESAHQIMVLCDDFHLPLGGIRIREAGATGGHNGLASIEDALGCSEYPRMRLGIGGPGDNSVKHVLSKFSSADEKIVGDLLIDASCAAEDWATGKSIIDLQAQFNRRKPQAGS
jgi:PTH1 family peptidyl-tRNA hydrolase